MEAQAEANTTHTHTQKLALKTQRRHENRLRELDCIQIPVPLFHFLGEFD